MIANPFVRSGKITGLVATVCAAQSLAAIIEVIGFIRLAPAMGLPAWAALPAFLPLLLIESTFPAWIHRMWAGRRRVWAAVMTIAFACSLVISVTSKHATIGSILSTADGLAAQKAEPRSNLERVLTELDARLRALTADGTPRPSTTVQARIDWYQIPTAVRRAIGECVVGSQHPACRPMQLLQQELAAARDYERLKGEADIVRDHLAKASREDAREPMPESFEILFGSFVHLEGKKGIALAYVIPLQLVASFGWYFIFLGKQLEGTRHQVAGSAEQEREPDLVGGSVVDAFHLPLGAQPGGQMIVDGMNTGTHATSTGARRGDAMGGHLQGGVGQGTTAGRVAPGSKANIRARPSSGQAMADFFDHLLWDPDLRSASLALWDYYQMMRADRGWPAMSAADFGRLMKAEVARRGGHKLKSSRQIYVGVGVPSAAIATTLCDHGIASARA